MWFICGCYVLWYIGSDCKELLSRKAKGAGTLVGGVHCYTAVLDWEEAQSEPQPQFAYSLQLLALFMLLFLETPPFIFLAFLFHGPCSFLAYSYFTALIFVASVRKAFCVITEYCALGFEMQCLNRFASQKNHCSFVSLGKCTDALWIPREELFALTATLNLPSPLALTEPDPVIVTISTTEIQMFLSAMKNF